MHPYVHCACIICKCTRLRPAQMQVLRQHHPTGLYLEAHAERRLAPGLALPRGRDQLHVGGQRVLCLARKALDLKSEEVSRCKTRSLNMLAVTTMLRPANNALDFMTACALQCYTLQAILLPTPILINYKPHLPDPDVTLRVMPGFACLCRRPTFTVVTRAEPRAHFYSYDV